MNLARTILAAILAAAPLIASAQADLSAEADSYQLLPQVQVDGAGIYFDQILVSPAPNKPVPHILMARAPQVGQSVSFSQNDIAILAQACASGLKLSNWTGSGEVRVSRRMRTMEALDLIDLLTATLQKKYVKNQGDLELHLTRPWAKLQVPDEALTLKVTEMPSTGVMPSFVITFELWAGRENLGSWQAPLRASVWRDIPVAHSTLQRGELLKDADVTMERADVLVQRDVYLNFPTTDETLELTESIPTGRPILNRSVRNRPLILRGEMVEGVFQDGTLAISLMVETLEDGALGQTVHVRNPKTRRELVGKVENEKTVRINL
jgi:flagella basal body P-ring formation protein FlgA